MKWKRAEAGWPDDKISDILCQRVSLCCKCVLKSMESLMTTQSVSCFKNIMLVVREKSEQDTKKVIDKMEGVNPVHWTSQDFWFHKVFGVVQGEDGADFARGWSMRTEI